MLMTSRPLLEMWLRGRPTGSNIWTLVQIPSHVVIKYTHGLKVFKNEFNFDAPSKVFTLSTNYILLNVTF